MPGIEFPESPFRTEELADWLELTAVEAADDNASAGDLERELNRLGHADPHDLLGSVFLEVERREKAAGKDGYPFDRKDSSIELKAEAKNFPAYIFCLALSYRQWRARKSPPQNPWCLFEELACYSAKKYIGGDALIFGTSSREGRKAKGRFQAMINDLAKRLGEGECFRPQRTFSAKDSQLDLVAWKGFPDSRPSQIILFGQCAAGANWTSKLNELIPEDFWDQWMNRGKVSTPLRSVFVPHRIFDHDRWENHARSARLLFDRCRVVAFAHHETQRGVFADRLLKCCREEWKLKV
jgi:hypothetical protein